MRVCESCGRDSNNHRIIKSKKWGMLCGRCYQRENLNPVTYELPKYGELEYSPEGKPICHVCGKAFDKVLSHAWQVHGLSAYEYKKEFGLETNKGIMSDKSTELARKRLEENYEIAVEENLLEGGKKTRFKKGDKGRTREQVSEQTRRKLIRQLRINDGSYVKKINDL